MIFARGGAIVSVGTTPRTHAHVQSAARVEIGGEGDRADRHRIGNAVQANADIFGRLVHERTDVDVGPEAIATAQLQRDVNQLAGGSAEASS